jgi:hypothetical protein
MWSSLAAEAGLDVAQTLAVGQLRKGRAAELLGTGQRTHTVAALIAIDNAVKDLPWQMLHHLREQRVRGELIVKPLREAGRALDSESANGSYSTWFAIWWVLQQIQSGCRRRVSCAYGDGCNMFGSPQAFSPGRRHSRIKCGQETHGEWFR